MQNNIFKYKKQWDEHDYVVIEAQMRTIDAYEFGYEDCANDTVTFLNQILIQSGIRIDSVNKIISDYKKQFKIEENA